jgi:hypothetical protein
MAHAKFTKEAVFEAADQLIAGGEKPTITRIRDIIGGGSPNDITSWMKEWRSRQQKILDAQRIPAPSGIRDQANVFLSDFVATVWDSARAEAERKLTAERQALSEAQTELELETGEALEIAEMLNVENMALKTQLQVLQAANAEIKAAMDVLKLQTESFKHAHDLAVVEKESTMREINTIKTQADRQQTMLETAQLKIDELQAEARKYREMQAKAERETALLQGELKAMSKQKG